MNRSDWLILLALAVIWGGAFFFIGVAVRHVPPLTYVWLRLTIAAAAMWVYPHASAAATLGLPRAGLGLDRAPRAAQQCVALHLVRLGPDAYRQRPRLDPQRDHADLGRGRRPFPHPRRADEPAQDRRRAARLRRRRDDDRPGSARRTSAPTRSPSSPASPPRSAMRWPPSGRAGSGGMGVSPIVGHHRPADRRRADHAAGVADRRPAVDAAVPAAQRLGRDHRAGVALHRLRLRALFPADRSRRARPTPCW